MTVGLEARAQNRTKRQERVPQTRSHASHDVVCGSGDLTQPLLTSPRHDTPAFVPSAGATYESFIKTGPIA